MTSISFYRKYINHRFFFIFLFLSPLFISCSSKPTLVNEILAPPKFPKEFLTIPESTDDPKLISLLSVDEKHKDITFGRKDPFLPPQSEGELLLVPNSFRYHGQISSANTINAFVSYRDQRGTVKPGDVGGENTDLLPNGWTILKLDADTKVLTLGYEDQSIDIDLFPEE